MDYRRGISASPLDKMLDAFAATRFAGIRREDNVAAPHGQRRIAEYTIFLPDMMRLLSLIWQQHRYAMI